LAVYEEVAKVAKSEKDPQLVNLKMQKVMMAYTLEMVKEKYPDDSVQVNLVQKQLDQLQKRIDALELQRKAPATQPGHVAPVTQPAPQEIRL
jgi:hypothetical protein